MGYKDLIDEEELKEYIYFQFPLWDTVCIGCAICVGCIALSIPFMGYKIT